MRLCAFLLVFCVLGLGALPVAAQSRWVLPAEQVSALSDALSLSGAVAPGLAISETDIRIDSDSLHVCYRRGAAAPLCLTLAHEETLPDGLPLGAGFVLKDPARAEEAPLAGLVEVLKKRLAGIAPEQVWRQARTQAPRISDELRPVYDSLNLLVRGLLGSGDMEHVGEALALADRLLPEAFRLDALRLRALAQSGEFDKARLLLESLPPGSERDLESARLLLLEGRTAEGLAQLSALEASLPQENGRCLAEDVARFMDKKGDKNAARTLRREAVEVFPLCGELWTNLAYAMLERGEAQSLYDLSGAALRDLPDQIGVLTARMVAARRLKKQEETEALLRRLYELSNDPAWILMHSTVISQDPANIPRLEYYRQRMIDEPDSLLHRHAVGVLSYYAGDYATSIAINDALRPLLPLDQRVLIYGAMSRYESGDWEGARRWLEDLEALLERLGPDTPVDPDIYYCKAVLWHRKDPQRALQELDRYLTSNWSPDATPSKRRLAFSYRERVQSGKAVEAWIPAAEKTPAFWRWAGWLLLGGLLLGSLLWWRGRPGRRA